MAGQTRIDGNLIDTGTDPNDIVSVSVGDARYPRLSQDNTLAGNLTVDGDLNLVATGAGTGVFTIAAPDSNTNRTLTLPDEAGTVLTDVGVPSSALPAGSVIQVVNNTFSTSTNVTTTSFVDSGLQASITPTNSSNKILILVDQHARSAQQTSNFRDFFTRLLRNSTEIAQKRHQSYGSVGSNGFMAAVLDGGFIVLDSPNVTNPITYKTQGAVGTSLSNTNLRFQDQPSIASITLMEIAG